MMVLGGLRRLVGDGRRPEARGVMAGMCATEAEAIMVGTGP
jgi:hypothetical protein